MISLKDHSALFAWLGLVAVVVFAMAWICAASVDTAWHFGVNNLSEFGISDTAARSYFNYGCMITGILVTVFGAGRTAFAINIGHALGGALLFSGGIALALIGVYTMAPETNEIHVIVALTAAVFIFAAIVAITFGNWYANRKLLAGIGIVVIFCMIPIALFLNIPSIEGYGIILALIWLTAESASMLIYKKKDY